MPHSIELLGVTLDYPMYSVRAQSLRNAVLNAAVGGRLYKSNSDLVFVRALSSIQLKLGEGDRLALVGHNGSGKTTLLRVMAGIYEPTSGRVEINGRVTSMTSFGAGLDMEATGLQNIRNMGLMRMVPRKVIERRIPDIVEFSELGDYVKLPVRAYSAGMLARLMFTVATEFETDILVLDEWLSAGDASFMSKAAERMDRMVESAKIVVLATHSPDLVRRVCNKVCALEGGRMVFLGSTDEWFQRQDAASTVTAA
jgi:lipopolysaccharide transport system ATP-binding protein